MHTLAVVGALLRDGIALLIVLGLAFIVVGAVLYVGKGVAVG